jgi:UDP-glucose 4-epimerase
MAYLVTGSTGFIGPYIIRDLIEEGQKVVAYDIVHDSKAWQRLLASESTDVQFVLGDVTDLGQLIRVAKEYKVDKIIHMAYILPFRCDANPWLAVKVNCEGTNNIFETARFLGLTKVVWASSCAVFGTSGKYSQDKVSNDAPQYPSGLYGACKCFNERQAEHYFKQFGVDSIGLRYPFLYGLGRGSGISMGERVTLELVEKPALGKSGRVPCGDDSPNWLYIEDAARAAILASNTSTTKTRIYNIGGEICSIKELADYVRSLIPDANITLESGTMGYQWKYDTGLIEEEIGFLPKWSTQQATREMINILRKEHSLPLV